MDGWANEDPKKLGINEGCRWSLRKGKGVMEEDFEESRGLKRVVVPKKMMNL